MINKDEKSSLYWKKFTEENKESKKEFEKAVSLYKILTAHKKVKWPEDMKQKSVKSLINIITADEKGSYGKKRKDYMINILMLVASIVIVVGLSVIFANIFNLTGGSGKNMYHEIIVPAGEKSQVHLSDGTKIWLNSESRLRYRSDYRKSERSVFLEGEGYFNVVKQKGSPFIVYTQNIRVDALGTIFDIKSYPDDPTIETTLVEGIIKIEDNGKKNKFSQIILQPNEKFVYNKANKTAVSPVAETKEKKDVKSRIQYIEPVPQITVNKVNTENITCWKDYLLVFDNETLEEMAVKMSRWYKLKVNILDDELKKQRYTGKFVNNETIYQVLKAINLTTPIEYTLTDNQIYISRKDSQKQNRKNRSNL
jgi:ferric-dicitrate binding protein FerR (iron transport regulator)